MNPLTLLEKQLGMWERALEKSNEFYKDGLISLEMHNIHIRNLTGKIAVYKQAIKILTEDKSWEQ